MPLIKIETSKDFKNLYQETENDEKITEISDAVGITIIRNYEEDSEYFKDRKKMFIKLYLRDGFLVGGIDMVKEDENRLYTIIHDNKKYKKRFTNFFFGPEEKIVLVCENDKICQVPIF
ncbi:MAG: hypothetical protein QMC93_03495 [Patescibacteria group bacterium]|nr:hypothetical protein [Patescibacteria group bacterium]